MHGARRHAERAKNGDIGSLVRDDHDEHRHDIEGRDGDDQHQDDPHHRFLDPDRPKIIGVLLRPVANGESLTQAGRERAADHGGDHRVDEVQLQTARTRVTRGERGHIVDVRERQGAIVIVQPRLEETRHSKLAQARRWRAGLIHTRHQQRHRVIHADAEQAREHATQDHPIRACLKIEELTLDDSRRRIRDLRLETRVDATQAQGQHLRLPKPERLQFDIRRKPIDPRLLAQGVSESLPLPMRERLITRVRDPSMGRQGQQTISQLPRIRS